jgi:hypothetical protein
MGFVCCGRRAWAGLGSRIHSGQIIRVFLLRWDHWQGSHISRWLRCRDYPSARWSGALCEFAARDDQSGRQCDLRPFGRPSDHALLHSAENRLQKLSRVGSRLGLCLLQLLSAQSTRPPCQQLTQAARSDVRCYIATDIAPIVGSKLSVSSSIDQGGGEAAPGWHSLIRRRERKELRPWSFISALWAGDDGVVVIVHRHRYVRFPTLRTAASDGYDHIFGHIILQARNAPKRPSDNLSAGTME